jgi:acyl carrier protein
MQIKINMAPTQSALAEELRGVIIKNLLFGQEDSCFTDQDSLVERGVIDSTSVLELVRLVEERYSITIDDCDIVPENLDSISNLCGFVESKMRQSVVRESACK